MQTEINYSLRQPCLRPVRRETVPRLKEYFYRAKNMPPHVVVQKAWQMGYKASKVQSRKLLSQFQPTYTSLNKKIGPQNFRKLLKGPNTQDLHPHIPQLSQLLKHYLQHEFDLLGSGWVKIHHGMQCQGVEGHRYPTLPTLKFDPQGGWLKGRINSANLKHSQFIWQQISSNYQPIDWQIDFKSGYRWQEHTYFTKIPYGHQLGVDIKIPWELSRGQHLPHLAYAYNSARAELLHIKNENPVSSSYSKNHSTQTLSQTIQDEFSNQVLDFIATNPPAFGVNWKCPMDVAIRAANWLIALDLFHFYGAEFATEFYQILYASLIDHGDFVFKHLEKGSDFRGNHYLADIAGLAVIGSYLISDKASGSSKPAQWLQFAYQELIKECDYQFYPEGTNFEGSTAYHRLSAEMLFYPTLLLLALPASHKADLNPANPDLLFPEWYFERIYKMAHFTRTCSKPNQQIVQFGDNDSGRFLKLQPYFLDQSGHEDFLDHRHLIAAIDGLFFETPSVEKNKALEFKIIQSTLSRETFKAIRHILPNSKLENLQVQPSILPSDESSSPIVNNSFHFQEYIFNLPGFRPEDVQLYSYPQMGYYFFKSSDFFLAVRCGAIGQLQRGGHDHNDQLAIELHYRGQDLIVDPGTYLYTSLPQKRNLYRSVRAHFTPQPEAYQEPLSLDQGLFYLGGGQPGQCLLINKTEFLGCHSNFGTPVYRRLSLQSEKVVIQDSCKEFSLRRLDAQYGLKIFSPSYGVSSSKDLQALLLE